MPKVIMVLQTSPKNAPGEYVNSLPPIKSPSEGLISGDTVPEKWTAEVATMEDVQKFFDKRMEELNARIALLEMELKRLVPVAGPKTKEEAEQAGETNAKGEAGKNKEAEKKAGEEKAAEIEKKAMAQKPQEPKTENQPEPEAEGVKAK